ncbi:uncharacterized protein LOC103719062 isoform X2 [Phoenix dactylifera]|uniref:Uncharacterized protein LOC103719062 isoform X2 n=1 Tax=Phoenix dactylifera TaxID=42345 RepID=A0A8B8JB11_PHODC|nr:uncharacterized protein LOC103719062 isoform X2 [Phoenix dactylifera]
MASATLLASPKTTPHPSPFLQQGKGRDAVYVAAVPLRAAKGPSQMLMSAAYSLGLWDLQHFMVIIKPDPSRPQAFVFDFQPQDPENVYTAVAALSGWKIPGVIRRRTLRRIPISRCWFVGFSINDGVDSAIKFNEVWSTDLIVGKRDCRHYTNGLVEHLTGEPHALECLRETSNG